MLQIVCNVLALAAIAFPAFLYRKVISPFSEKYSEEKSNARFITDAKALNAALVVAAREELAGQPA